MSEVFELLLFMALEESVVAVLLLVLGLEVLELLLLLILVESEVDVEFMISELEVLLMVGSLLITTELAGGTSVVMFTEGRKLVELCEDVLSTLVVLIELAVLLMMVSFVGMTGLLVVLLTIDAF